MSTLNVVLAAGFGISLGMIGVALNKKKEIINGGDNKKDSYLLHSLEESAALIIGDVEALATEVGGEELGEAGDDGGNQVIIRILAWEGRLEEHCGLQTESLQVGVQELTCGVNPGTLEGVTSDHGRVGVVSDPL